MGLGWWGSIRPAPTIQRDKLGLGEKARALEHSLLKDLQAGFCMGVRGWNVLRDFPLHLNDKAPE
jgi:hypothetical protein